MTDTFNCDLCGQQKPQSECSYGHNFGAGVVYACSECCPPKDAEDTLRSFDRFILTCEQQIRVMEDATQKINAQHARIEELLQKMQQLKRENAALIKVLRLLAKSKDVPNVTVAELAEYAQRAIDAATDKQQ